MSIVQKLLFVVSNYPGGYRLIYDIIYSSEKPGNSKRFKNTTRNTLSRLKRQGLVSNRNGEWKITEEGKEFLHSVRNKEIKRFYYSKFPKLDKKKKLIITFDIPEKKRKYRDWLRIELVGLGFEIIHKSVWFGPTLPKAFVEYLEEIDLLKYMRFFKANSAELI